MAGEPVGPAELFREWVKAARQTAARHAVNGDPYEVELALARADVYAESAELVDERGDLEAAKLMVDNAARLRVQTPPLVGFDAAGLRYIRARAWQFCAQHLDPDAPTPQPPWD